MKKSFILLIILLSIIGFYCSKTENKIGTGTNSFDAVTVQLDKGGDLYLYFNSEKVISSVGNFFNKMIKIIESKLPPQKKDEISNVINFISSIISDIGISEISGVGISTIPIENNINRSRFVAYHNEADNKGLIWQLLGESKALNELNLLPEDTVFAEFGSFNPALLWNWIKKKSDVSNIPEIKNTINRIEPMLTSAGIDLNKTVNSFSGKIGYFLTLDKEKTNTIPLGGGKSLNIPEPALAIFFSVKDAYLFDLLKSKMPFAKFSEEENTQILSIPVPKLPVSIAPMIIKKDDLLIFASNKTIFEKIKKVKKNKSGLIATKEFKTISNGIPTKGTSFKYVGKRVFKTIFDIQKKIISMQSNPNMDDKTAKEFIDLLQSEFFFYGVSENGKNGIIYTANHSFSVERMAIIPGVIVAGVVSAIAIPNLLRALQNGKQIRTLGDIKSIATAIEMYRTQIGYLPKFNSFKELIEDKDFRAIAGSSLPKKDGWENPFYYKLTEDKESYFVGSAGKDGVFNGFDQKGKYVVISMEDFKKDIIYSNGEYIFAPNR